MKTVQNGDAIWLTRAQAGAPSSLRRQRVHVLARAACVAGLLTGAVAPVLLRRMHLRRPRPLRPLQPHRRRCPRFSRKRRRDSPRRRLSASSPRSLPPPAGPPSSRARSTRALLPRRRRPVSRKPASRPSRVRSSPVGSRRRRVRASGATRNSPRSRRSTAARWRRPRCGSVSPASSCPAPARSAARSTAGSSPALPAPRRSSSSSRGSARSAAAIASRRRARPPAAAASARPISPGRLALAAAATGVN